MEQQKSFLKKYKWIFLIGAIIVIMILAVPKGPKIPDGPRIPDGSQILEVAIQDNPNQVKKDSKTGWPSVDAKYITAMPVDLAQIQSISKYRSCAGHDKSGYSFERNLESERSMKHYFYPIPIFQGTLDKVKMFVPFDGTISKIVFERDEIGKPGKRPKTGNGVTISTPVDKNVLFEFGHIYFIKDYKVGDSVKAGELIGYAALGEKLNDFDIDLWGAVWTDDQQPILGSAFDHMTDSVLAEFAKYGITPDNTKISKEYRNIHPCNYAIQRNNAGREGEDWMRLKR